MAARAETLVTAGVKPELFAERGVVSLSRTLVIAVISLLVLAGFSLRVGNLSAEGLSEDELNKLQAVAEYRTQGLTAANGEHPFLMKALQTGTMILADRWNQTSLAASDPSLRVAPETALRLPAVIFGALTVILIYLLATELFGAEVGLIAAALWAFDPNAIGFNRIAKEDTFLAFFFLLANVFWLRGQRVAESEGTDRAHRYYWATAIAIGAMLASKYVPQLFGITIAYYWLFQNIPATRWRLGHKRMLVFFGVMGLSFIAFNPTILLPSTWQQMGMFAGQKLVGHDAYEFMGKLYSHRMTDWLNGIPWYFYGLFLVVKLPLLSLVGFLIGLPLLFRRKLGDGRYFIMLWMFLWVMMFSFAGGKFTRYMTAVLPAVLITTALGVQTAASWLARNMEKTLAPANGKGRTYVAASLATLVVLGSVLAATMIAPHFRLYTNAIGGGTANAGYYFPHDEFYDASTREAVFEIAKSAKPGARVASETPGLAAYYAGRAGRSDLVSVSLSDPTATAKLNGDDFIIDARGRRYFSNDNLLRSLQQQTPVARLSLDGIPSANIYRAEVKSSD